MSGEQIDPESDPTLGTGNGIVWVGSRDAIHDPNISSKLEAHVVAVVMFTHQTKGKFLYPLHRDQADALAMRFGRMLGDTAKPKPRTAAERYLASKKEPAPADAGGGTSLKFDHDDDGIWAGEAEIAGEGLPEDAVGAIAFKSHGFEGVIVMPLEREFVELLRKRLALALSGDVRA